MGCERYERIYSFVQSSVVKVEQRERDVAEEGGEKKEFFSPEPMYPFD